MRRTRSGWVFVGLQLLLFVVMLKTSAHPALLGWQFALLSMTFVFAVLGPPPGRG